LTSGYNWGQPLIFVNLPLGDETFVSDLEAVPIKVDKGQGRQAEKREEISGCPQLKAN
jgi:hypothetical protein